MIELTVNGNIDPKTPLLWVLRDHLKLTGTKYGCGIQNCLLHCSRQWKSCPLLWGNAGGRCWKASHYH